jgi:hypothetical protein
MDILMRLWVVIILVGLFVFPIYGATVIMKKKEHSHNWDLENRIGYGALGILLWLCFCVLAPGVATVAAIGVYSAVKFVLGIP